MQRFYASLQRGWDCQGLVSGRVPKVQRIVLQNLRAYRRLSDFSHFRVEAADDYVDHYWCIQVNAFRSNPPSFRPIRVWRAENGAFACGDEWFVAR
jgi:hypothetical protein